jgi:hypothetical protein
MRELVPLEVENVAFLTSIDVPFGILEVTATGLSKSILDATESFRAFLQEVGIHDFDRQPQGPDFKVLLPAQLAVDNQHRLDSLASLYRPVSKQGDPRVWFRQLGKAIRPSDVVAAIWTDDKFWLFNLTDIDLRLEIESPGIVQDVLGRFAAKKSTVVSALLEKLRAVSEKGYLPAPVVGSTAIGRLLESELGIEINSRRDPDYFGIEIKSSRKASNRTTLFAKTPAWADSRLKSSRELLAAFGYDRGGHRKLSCTLSATVTNSQGLRLIVDTSADLLHAIHEGPEIEKAVQWDLEALRHSLATKHNETFWVKADTRLVDGWEYIRFNAVQHTQKPMVVQLPTALAHGTVTVDFLIRESGDKGYLFKILPKNIEALFPPAVKYVLGLTDRISGPPPAAMPTLF